MLEVTEAEEENSMSLDMFKLMHFCCLNELEIQFENTEKGTIRIWKKEYMVILLDFSDLHYPKNILRNLKEKLDA